MTKKTHKDLDCWKKSIAFVTEIYRVSKNFPKSEMYGLTSQLRRSAISIPSNIAEGAARNSDREFIRFLYIALGSIAECETQIEIASRIGYLDNVTDLNNQITDIRRLTQGLIRYLKENKN